MKWSCVFVLAVASLWCEVSGVRHRRSSAASGSYVGVNSDGSHYGGTFDPTSHQSLQQDLNLGLDHNLYAPSYPFSDPIAAAVNQNGFASDYFRTLSLFLQQKKRGAMASASAFASSDSGRNRTPGFASAQTSASGTGGIGRSNRAFMNNINNQRTALEASQRAFALAAQGNGGYQGPASFGYGYNPGYNTGYNPGFNPGFNPAFNPGYNAGFPQGGFQQAGGNTQGYQGGGGNPQAAFASASIDPTGTRQIASISPSNPNSPNVDVHGPAPSRGGGDGKFYGVSSSSFSSSSNVNGVPTSQRTAHTVINDNGKITEHKVAS